MRDRATMVCRDCGEVTHIALATVKPGSMVSCNACGLVVHAAQLRLPPSLGLGASAPAASGAGPLGGAARPRARPGLRR